MATYTEIKTALDEIAERSTLNMNRRDQARNTLLQAQQDLLAMQSNYSAVITSLNAQAAANPDDAAWQAAKAEKDQMVSDFQALKAEIDALITAIGG